jgi:hypothetical protein
MALVAPNAPSSSNPVVQVSDNGSGALHCHQPPHLTRRRRSSSHSVQGLYAISPAIEAGRIGRPEGNPPTSMHWLEAQIVVPDIDASPIAQWRWGRSEGGTEAPGRKQLRALPFLCLIAGDSSFCSRTLCTMRASSDRYAAMRGTPRTRN